MPLGTTDLPDGRCVRTARPSQRLLVEDPGEAVCMLTVRLDVADPSVHVLVLDHRLVRVEADSFVATGPRAFLGPGEQGSADPESLVRRTDSDTLEEHAVTISHQDEKADDLSLRLGNPR